MIIRPPRSTPIVSCCCLKISLLFLATVIIFFTAGLLSLVLRARRLLGAYRIPMETGLLIPSDKSGGLNGSTQHSARTHLALKTRAKIAREVRSVGTLPWLGFDRVQPNRSVLQGKYCRIN